MKILVLAAHADDEVLGCGGTIAHLLEHENEVIVCFVTDGASAQYSDLTLVEERKKSALTCSKMLGVNRVKFLDFPDQGLESCPHLQLNKAIERIIDEEKPESIYTHSPHDINKDHRVVYESTLVACRPYRRRVKELISYELPGKHLYHFEPNLYVDITSTLEHKLEAFRCYSTEIEEYPKPRSLDAIRAWAATRGIESGLKYAEAFRIIYSIRMNDSIFGA